MCRSRVRHDASAGGGVEGDSETQLQGSSGVYLESAEHGEELVHCQVGRGRAAKGVCLFVVCLRCSCTVNSVVVVVVVVEPCFSPRLGAVDQRVYRRSFRKFFRALDEYYYV